MAAISTIVFVMVASLAGVRISRTRNVQNESETGRPATGAPELDLWGPATEYFRD